MFWQLLPIQPGQPFVISWLFAVVLFIYIIFGGSSLCSVVQTGEMINRPSKGASKSTLNFSQNKQDVRCFPTCCICITAAAADVAAISTALSDCNHLGCNCVKWTLARTQRFLSRAPSEPLTLQNDDEHWPGKAQTSKYTGELNMSDNFCMKGQVFPSIFPAWPHTGRTTTLHFSRNEWRTHNKEGTKEKVIKQKQWSREYFYKS